MPTGSPTHTRLKEPAVIRCRDLVCLFVTILALDTSCRAADVVKLSKADDRVAVTINGQDFTTFQFAKPLPKPFFSPVKAADGTVLTRPIVGEDYKGDHPHHKGIWVSVDEVNEIKFWAEKGKIENRSVDLIAAEGNPAKLKVVNHWISPAGGDVMIETTSISIFTNRMLAYDIHFKMVGGDVHFKDTKEGLFGVRIAESQREDKGAGVVTNADGQKGTKECWGQRSAWVASSALLTTREMLYSSWSGSLVTIVSQVKVVRNSSIHPSRDRHSLRS